MRPCCVIFVILFAISKGFPTTDYSIEQEIGKSQKICCPIIDFSNNVAVNLVIDSEKRIVVTADRFLNFSLPKHKWKFFSQNPLCVLKKKLEVQDHNKTISCKTISDGGLGVPLTQTIYDLYVYDRPSVKEFNVLSIEGDPLSYTCETSGYPNLTTVIKLENQIIHSQSTNRTYLKVKQEVIGKALKNNTAIHCIATSTMSNGRQEKAVKSLNIVVKSRPTILSDNMTISVIKNEATSFIIRVKGQPVPTVNCTNSAKIAFVSTDNVGVKIYNVTISNLTDTIFNNGLQCFATNNLDTSSSMFKFTLKPEIPIIISHDKSEYTNYYQLVVKMRSASPLIKAFIKMNGKSEELSLIDHLNSTTIKPKNANGYMLLAQHLTNLLANREYVVGVIICNKYGCSRQKKIFTTANANNLPVSLEVLSKPPIILPDYMDEYVSNAMTIVNSIWWFTCIIVLLQQRFY